MSQRLGLPPLLREAALSVLNVQDEGGQVFGRLLADDRAGDQAEIGYCTSCVSAGVDCLKKQIYVTFEP